MEDVQIVGLYQARDETAIQKTTVKYGRMLYAISYNLLSNHEDSEEIVNDTYAAAWNTIPPQCPKSLSAYLGRIARNLSINRWHKQGAQKRYPGIQFLLSELNDCVPDTETVETALEARELTRIIDEWLGSLPAENRILFLRRYWFGEAVKEIATDSAMSPNKLAGRLYHLRQSLKNTLEMEGILL